MTDQGFSFTNQRWPLAGSTKALSRQRNHDGLRVVRNNVQQDQGRASWFTISSLPVAKGRRRKSKPGGELHLRHTDAGA